MTRFRGARLHVVNDGDSNCNLPAAPDNIPTVLAAALDCPFTNRGVDAALATQSRMRFASRCAPLGNCAATTVYHLLVGHNDINFTANAATVLSRMELLADLAHAAGFDLVVTSTITPTDTFTGGEPAIRVAANDLLIANANGKFDLVVDLTEDATFEDYESAYYADGLHKSIAGAAAYVNTYAAPQIAALL